MISVLAGPAGDAGDFRVINDFARDSGWLHGFMSGYTDYGIALFGLLLVAGWLLARRRDDIPGVAAVGWAGIGAVVALALNQLVSHTVAEPRPFRSLPHVLVLVHRSSDFGFTSDHAVLAGAIATGLLYVDRRLGVFTWCAAIVFAFSRVYVGVHYPHDVVAGLGLGTAVVLVGRILAQPLFRWLLEALAGTRLRPLLTARSTGGYRSAYGRQ